MFKFKKIIAEQSREIAELKNKLRRSERDVESLKEELREFICAEDGTPADCKRGSWCGACEFSKVLRIHSGWHQFHNVYFCNKGESCPNFVEKKEY